MYIEAIKTNRLEIYFVIKTDPTSSLANKKYNPVLDHMFCSVKMCAKAINYAPTMFNLNSVTYPSLVLKLVIILISIKDD